MYKAENEKGGCKNGTRKQEYAQDCTWCMGMGK